MTKFEIEAKAARITLKFLASGKNRRLAYSARRVLKNGALFNQYVEQRIEKKRVIEKRSLKDIFSGLFSKIIFKFR